MPGLIFSWGSVVAPASSGGTSGLPRRRRPPMIAVLRPANTLALNKALPDSPSADRIAAFPKWVRRKKGDRKGPVVARMGSLAFYRLLPSIRRRFVCSTPCLPIVKPSTGFFASGWRSSAWATLGWWAWWASRRCSVGYGNLATWVDWRSANGGPCSSPRRLLCCWRWLPSRHGCSLRDFCLLGSLCFNSCWQWRRGASMTVFRSTWPGSARGRRGRGRCVGAAVSLCGERRAHCGPHRADRGTLVATSETPRHSHLALF